MKKLLLATAILAVSAGVVLSDAKANTSVDLTINGEIGKECDISQFGAETRLQGLDLTSTAESERASVTLTCNYQGTASVTFESANGGNLVSGSNEIPYTACLTGSPFSCPTGMDLSSPVTWPGFPTVVGDQSRGFSVVLDPPAIVPAGFYEDVVTASVLPN